MDIVKPAAHCDSDIATMQLASGFLAARVEEYAQCMCKIAQMGAQARMSMAAQSREAAARFSTQAFTDTFVKCMNEMMRAL